MIVKFLYNYETKCFWNGFSCRNEKKKDRNLDWNKNNQMKKTKKIIEVYNKLERII